MNPGIMHTANQQPHMYIPLTLPRTVFHRHALRSSSCASETTKAPLRGYRRFLGALIAAVLSITECSIAQQSSYSSNRNDVISQIHTKDKTLQKWFDHISPLLRASKFEKVLDECDKSLKTNPTNTVIWCMKGATLGLLGRKGESLKAFTKATEVDPKNNIAWFAVAGMLSEAGRYGEAIEAATKGIEADTKEAAAGWNIKGFSQLKLERSEEGLDSFNKALELSPAHPDALSGRGWALGKLGRTEDAMAEFDKAIKADRKTAMAWLGRAACLLQLGRRSEGEKCLKEFERLTKAQAYPVPR